jgi:hypothetical protein
VAELLSSKAIAANCPDKVSSEASLVRESPNMRWNFALNIKKENLIGLKSGEYGGRTLCPGCGGSRSCLERRGKKLVVAGH